MKNRKQKKIPDFVLRQLNGNRPYVQIFEKSFGKFKSKYKNKIKMLLNPAHKNWS